MNDYIFHISRDRSLTAGSLRANVNDYYLLKIKAQGVAPGQSILPTEFCFTVNVLRT